MFNNFHLAKNLQTANNSTTTDARENISAHLESLEFQKIFDAHFAEFKNNQILLNKISHRFLVTSTLFIA
jgi:hypothetical protein